MLLDDKRSTPLKFCTGTEQIFHLTVSICLAQHLQIKQGKKSTKLEIINEGVFKGHKLSHWQRIV
jgi:hypothetical protein